MTDVELAYLAGIVDGEGCIGVYRGRTCLVPRVTVRITHKPTIQLLHESLGGYTGCRATPEGNRKPQWYWNASSQKAATAIRAIIPFLRVKRQQAELVLELSALQHANNGVNATGRVTPRQLEIERELHALNKKGRLS